VKGWKMNENDCVHSLNNARGTDVEIWRVAEGWGWGLGTETGKGKRGWVPVFGLDAVASHPWSGGCSIMSVSTLGVSRFAPRKMTPYHPSEVRPRHGCALLYLHLRTTVDKFFDRKNYVFCWATYESKAKILEHLGTTIVPRWFYPVRDPRSHPRLHPYSLSDNTHGRLTLRPAKKNLAHCMSQHWHPMMRRQCAFRIRVGHDLLSPCCDGPLRGNDSGVGANSRRRHCPLSLPLPLHRSVR
jgi:hypothetical protein